MTKPPNNTALIPLTPGGRGGGTARMDKVDRDRLAALGYKMDWLLLNYADGDKQNGYVRQNALLPDGQTHKHQIARLIAALMLLEEEQRTGKPAKAKGWTVRYRDGDRLNLTRANLEIVDAAEGRRSNSYKALWDVKERMRLVAEGKDPNAVFRARRPKPPSGPKGGAK